MGCKHAAVIFVTVLAALLHSVDAAWSVQASIRNLCSETIVVTFSGYDAGDATYTVAPYDTAYYDICGSGCTGFLGACWEYTWSYSAYVADTSYSYSWPVDTHKISICGTDVGGVTDAWELNCDDMGDYAPLQESTPSTQCEYGYDYNNPDYCATGNSDPPSPDPPSPDPPSPVFVPSIVPIPDSPSPASLPPSPSASPALVIPVPPVDQKPTTSIAVTFLISGSNFDTEKFKEIISQLSQVQSDWIDVSLETSGTSSRRRRRRLTQAQNIKVNTTLYTTDPGAVTNRIKAAVNDGTVGKQMAASNWVLSETVFPNEDVSGSGSSSSSTAAIVGGVVGGIVCLALIAGGAAAFIVHRKKRAAGTGAPATINTAATNSSPPPSPPPADGDLPPTLPSAAPAQSTSSQQHLESSKHSSQPPTRPPTDPFMSWISEHVKSTPPQQRSNLLGDHEIPFDELVIDTAIGEGSFGRVYSATHNNVPVAVKVLLDTTSGRVVDPLVANSALSASSPIMGKLRDEVSLMSNMEHPNVVHFIGVCTLPPCIVTELCAKGSLSDVIKLAGASSEAASGLTWSRRIAMATDAAEGLLYLHSQTPPIIHRDLKSANMLVTDTFQVKISDFNLSKILDDSTRSSSLAAMNPRWLAPELFSGGRGTPACDIFAFGVVLWELLELQCPWGAINPWQIVSAIQRGERLSIPARENVRGAAPSSASYDRFVKLMNRCWTQTPEARISSADLVKELRLIGNENFV